MDDGWLKSSLSLIETLMGWGLSDSVRVVSDSLWSLWSCEDAGGSHEVVSEGAEFSDFLILLVTLQDVESSFESVSSEVSELVDSLSDKVLVLVNFLNDVELVGSSIAGNHSERSG